MCSFSHLCGLGSVGSQASHEGGASGEHYEGEGGATSPWMWPPKQRLWLLLSLLAALKAWMSNLYPSFPYAVSETLSSCHCLIQSAPSCSSAEPMPATHPESDGLSPLDDRSTSLRCRCRNPVPLLALSWPSWVTEVLDSPCFAEIPGDSITPCSFPCPTPRALLDGSFPRFVLHPETSTQSALSRQQASQSLFFLIGA